MKSPKLAKQLSNIGEVQAFIEAHLGISYSETDLVQYAIEGRISPAVSVPSDFFVDQELLAWKYWEQLSDSEDSHEFVEDWGTSGDDDAPGDSGGEQLDTESADNEVPKWVWVKDSNAAVDPLQDSNRLLYLDVECLKQFFRKFRNNELVVAVETGSFYTGPDRDYPIVIEHPLKLAFDVEYTLGPNAPAEYEIFFTTNEIHKFVSEHTAHEESPGKSEGLKTQERRELVFKGWLAAHKIQKEGCVEGHSRQEVWDELGTSAPDLFPAGMRIPVQSCHRFHGKAATRSTGKLPPIPVNPATP